MTSPAPLATPEHLAAYLGVPHPNVEQATFLLDAASGLVRAYCGWPITNVEDTTIWTVAGTGRPVLFVPTLNLRAITLVVADGDVVDLTDVRYNSAGVIFRRDPRRWPANRLVEVSGVSGYVTTPPELVAVVCAIASRSIATAGKGPITSYRVGGLQVTYGRDGPAEVITVDDTERRVLDHYRLPDLV